MLLARATGAHVVTALILDIPVIGVRIFSSDCKPPSCMTRDIRFQPTTLDRARRLALMSLSGGCGERRFCGEFFDNGNATDLEKARSHLGWWYDADQVEIELEL